VWLLKNPSGRLCRSLSLRRFVAAEKRDYRGFSLIRQAFRRISFFFRLHCQAQKTFSYSPPPP
ncbi:hypothetical protein, partial [Cupriavidus sp. D384]|uniref:hypothetical protein n=1 Tax=Cupriavidus sp. D384 TaxID=1538095 RepID=UPI001E59DDD7